MEARADERLNARVDLDDRVLGRVRRQRELDVAAALDPERANDRERRRAQSLMDRIGQGLDRGHHDRVAGVHAQRIDVLHRAHRDARVIRVAHDLVLDLLPADQALLDHDLADGARTQPAPDTLAVRRLGADDAATRAAQRERRPDDGRQPDVVQRALGRGVALGRRRAADDRARCVGLADPVEQVPEALPVLGHLDRLERRAEQTHVMALEHAGAGQSDGQVERRLAAEPGQQPVGSLAGDHRLHGLDRERLEVDRVGDVRVGHDRGRVRVDEDRPDALRPQRATGLRAGVVELGRLADHDRARAEDQDRARSLGAGRSPSLDRHRPAVTPAPWRGHAASPR